MKVLEKRFIKSLEMIHQFYPNKTYRKAPPTVRHTDKKIKNTKLVPATEKH